MRRQPLERLETTESRQKTPLDPESDGYDLGESDGCISAFELPVDGAFFYGPDGYDESVCP